MSKEIWAILHHYSSTIAKPMHCNYPMDIPSWCSYQRDIVNGTNSYKYAKYPIADSIATVVTPIFDRFAEEAFLEGCKNVSNQNANESFNNVLQSFSPKEQFNSPLTTSLAIGLAICVYNSGLQFTVTNLLKKCDLEFNNKSLDQWYKMYKERNVQGDYAAREERKKARKQKKTKQNIQHDAFQKNEGTQYQPQRFHSNSKRL